MIDPKHPKYYLLYEFNTNESEDPSYIIFHSLGYWRMTPGLDDVLFNPKNKER